MQFKKINKTVEFYTFHGTTDGRFLRQRQIPVIGFSPIIDTPVLLHDHDEFIGVSTFLEGIKIFEEIIDFCDSDVSDLH